MIGNVSQAFAIQAFNASLSAQESNQNQLLDRLNSISGREQEGALWRDTAELGANRDGGGLLGNPGLSSGSLGNSSETPLEATLSAPGKTGNPLFSGGGLIAPENSSPLSVAGDTGFFSGLLGQFINVLA